MSTNTRNSRKTKMAFHLTFLAILVLSLPEMTAANQRCTMLRGLGNPINVGHMFLARAQTEFKSTEPATIVSFHYQNKRDLGNGQVEEVVAFKMVKKPEFRNNKEDLGYYYIVVSILDQSGNFQRVVSFLRGKISSTGQKWINGTDGGNNDLASVINKMTGLSAQSSDMADKYCGRFLKFEYEWFYYLLKNYYSAPGGRDYALKFPWEKNQ